MARGWLQIFLTITVIQRRGYSVILSKRISSEIADCLEKMKQVGTGHIDFLPLTLWDSYTTDFSSYAPVHLAPKLSTAASQRRCCFERRNKQEFCRSVLYSACRKAWVPSYHVAQGLCPSRSLFVRITVLLFWKEPHHRFHFGPQLPEKFRRRLDTDAQKIRQIDILTCFQEQWNICMPRALKNKLQWGRNPPLQYHPKPRENFFNANFR